MSERALKVLQGVGWSFHNDGVTVGVQVDGKRRQVFVPAKHLWVEFGREFQRIGCPLQGVGDFSVGGWFSSITRSISRAAKRAVRTVKRGVRRVANVAKTIHRKYVTPALRIAKVVINNPIVRHGIKLAAVALPVLAPVALGVEAAAQALKLVDDGKRAAERVYNAAKTGQRILQGDRAAMARALGVQRNMQQVVGLARRGNPAAQRIIGAFQQLAA